MNLTDKMAYLRGMVDGMELDLTTTKEGKVLGQLLDVMQEMTAYVTDLQTQVDELTEVCDLFDQDLGDLEDIVYDEDDDDDEPYGTYRRGGRMGRSSYGRRREYDREYDERDYEKERMFPYEDELKRGRSVRYIRY